jgi:diaminopropionate ammonia-lyase
MVAGLQALARAAGIAMGDLDCLRDIALPRLICASDGNHGLAVTAAAQRAAHRLSLDSEVLLVVTEGPIGN